ncbi:AAA family ATPase [Parafannyhessea umbonata]|uniref:AAA family ATPase n=1 Tax=Parafannyhessea umbonata TaxID=604330 RepID=UPI00359C9FD3
MLDVRFGTEAAGGFGAAGDLGGADGSARAVDAIEAILARPRDEVLAQCRRYVVGQEDVLREVVGLTYSCLQRMEMRARGVDDLDLPRACAFMLSGSTASGKSFVMKVVAKVMGLELVSIDCSGITGAGWVGDSVSSELRRVAGVMEKDDGRRPVLAFWDEADKLVRKTREGGRSFDSQGNFLKLLDGGTLELAPEAQGQSEVTLDAGRVLNVFAGAFMGIEGIVRKRLLSGGLELAGAGSVAPGLLTTDQLRVRMNLQDLVSWGFMPEFVGRFGAVVCVPALTCANLRQIVKGSERSLERRVSNLLGAGRAFRISDAAADAIAREAHESGLGARRIDQVANHFEAEATVRLHADDSVNVATLDVDADGGLCLAFGFDEDVAEGADGALGAGDAAGMAGAGEKDNPAAGDVAVEAGASRFEPNERLIAAVDGAMAGARWADAAATAEGRELLARRLAHYQRWRVRDARSVDAAELLLEAVSGYLAVNRDPDMRQTLGYVCALLRFADIGMRDGWTYLDTLFFGRVEVCGLRGLEERASFDPAYCSCDAVRALSCYRRYLAFPDAVRREAVGLAQARATDAATSAREAAWLRADVNGVADAVDKEAPAGMTLMF